MALTATKSNDDDEDQRGLCFTCFRQYSSYGERGVIVVTSRGCCNSGWSYSSKSRCAGTAALYGAILLCEEPSSLPLVVIATVLLLLIVPPVSPLSYEGPFPPSLPPIPPPCLNATFHDRDSAIVAWYDSGARPKRPMPGLG
ncbi:hypothetical protein B296_00048103 [Ensete ventricosum]|uniref:Uncharacterized protein n=1 Tax=Ensete ventricosum TaxID=4639 RepID=A0A426XM72_ENSVE|nr:hypothetical protein B296_00048103 [Ensete ventricosum]